MSISAFGQVELSDLQNGVFHLAAAGFVDVTRVALSYISDGWRAAAGSNLQTIGANWILVESAWGGVDPSIQVQYPSEVYANFMSRYDAESLKYTGTISVFPDNAAPSGCAVNGTNIECDDPPVKTLALFSWNGATFTDTEEVAVSGTFSGVAPGDYVVGFTGAEFCTTFLKVN
jgi:hypothetical protein